MTKTTVQKHFDKIAPKYDFYTKKRDLHYSTLKKLLKSLIPPDKKVFEVGCGTGDLLVALSPKSGYGLDISGEMIKRASSKYKSEKSIKFSTEWPKRNLSASKEYDFIFMSDVVEHLENPKEIFDKISSLMGPKTKFINTMMNPVWEPVEILYNHLGWKMPEGPHNRIKYKDLRIVIQESGMKIIKHDYKLLMPIKIPFITVFLNKYIEKYLKPLAFIEYFIAIKR